MKFVMFGRDVLLAMSHLFVPAVPSYRNRKPSLYDSFSAPTMGAPRKGMVFLDRVRMLRLFKLIAGLFIFLLVSFVQPVRAQNACAVRSFQTYGEALAACNACNEANVNELKREYGASVTLHDLRCVVGSPTLLAGSSTAPIHLVNPSSLYPFATADPGTTSAINNTYWSGYDFSFQGSAGKNFGSGGCQGGEGSAGGGGGSGTGGNANTSATGCAPTIVGDPINASTGNKYLQDDDYVGNPWLTFRRFYNSDANITSTAIGQNWRNSFDRSLQMLSSEGPTSSIALNRPDGGAEVFNKSNGQWTTDSDTPNTITEIDNAQGIATGYSVFVAALRHTEIYNASGLLQSVTDATGQGITLSYSTVSTPSTVAPSPNLLLTVTDPNGRQLNFTYDSLGRLHQVTLPDNGVLSYVYDASNGNLLTVQYPDGKTRQYIYNESTLTGGANLPHVLTGIVDETGVRYASTTYNSSGQATSSNFVGNIGSTRVTYTANGYSTIQYPLGLTSTMSFSTVQGVNKIASLDQPCSPQCRQSFKTRTYDANGYPASTTDFSGNVTTTTYDVHGLLNQQVDAVSSANQLTTTTTWDTVNRVPQLRTVADNKGVTQAKTAWVYNSRAQAIARCDIDPSVSAAASYTCATTGTPPTGVRRTTSTYCDAVDTTQCPLIGLLLSATGPRTDVTDLTQYSYYLSTDESGCGTAGGACHRAGDLYQVTDALGHVSTVVAYDKNGGVVRQRDANGVITDLTYHPRGWLLTRTVRANADGSASAGDALTQIAYDATGNV
ncbi:DUF6531 domain-containing protein, partial [Dyella silvatica]|uniref:DUF6531 domain-containing protein n=1 Tax=Dyella silvatica TaxID=2992128 RepID=UPI00224DFDE9